MVNNQLEVFKNEKKAHSKKGKFSDWGIVGHSTQIEYLMSSASSDDLVHTYLFAGEEKIGKKKIALAFIMTLLCRESLGYCGNCNSCIQIKKGIHPDVSILYGLDSIKIKEVRELISKINLKPFNSFYKVAIIDNAERLTLESANALLKTLEEPPGQAVLVLITNNSTRLLPTIVSRSRVIKFFRVHGSEILKILQNKNIEEDKKRLIFEVSMGRPGRVFELLENKEELEELDNNFKEFLDIIKGDKVKNLDYSLRLAKIYDSDPETVLNIFNFWIMILRDIIYSKIQKNYKSLVTYYYNKESLDKFSIDNIVEVIKYINSMREIISNPRSGFNIKLIFDLLVLKLQQVKN